MDISLEELLVYYHSANIQQIKPKAEWKKTYTLDKFGELLDRVDPDHKNKNLDALINGDDRLELIAVKNRVLAEREKDGSQIPSIREMLIELQKMKWTEERKLAAQTALANTPHALPDEAEEGK